MKKTYTPFVVFAKTAALRKIVGKTLKDAGISAMEMSESMDATCIYSDGTAGIGYEKFFKGNPLNYAGKPFGPIIDAATEFGKLVELLEAKPEVKIKLKNHEAVVAADKSGVQIGCQWASKDQVEKVRKAMGKKMGQQEMTITLGESHTLCRIVLDLLKKAGYGTLDTEKPFKHPYIGKGGYVSTERLQHGGYHLCYGSQSVFDKYKKKIVINAATEMGKLIDLLEGNKEKKLKITLSDSAGFNNPVDATINEDSVTVMGETITKAQVEEIWGALQ